MLTLKELQEQYFGRRQRVCVEVDDPEIAKRFFSSRTSAAWGNGIIKGTGWAVIMQPSPEHKGDRAVAFVCKVELLGDLAPCT